MKLKARYIYIWLLAIIVVSACRSKTSDTPEEEVQAGTPVTITSVTKDTLAETIELSAVSSFLLKTQIKAVTNGYLQNVTIKQGSFVKKGERVMSIITKEAQSIGNAINKLDSSFHFRGEIPIVAPGSGYISQLNFQSGDYVQDGEQIAIISDSKSFAFILEIPYELTNLVKSNRKVMLLLPDSSEINGYIEEPLPTVDAATQTQSYRIAVDNNIMIPENLIAKVFIVKSSKQDANSISKDALLTDETQSNFWVMKLINDSTAVKVPVIKGIASKDKVEILSPLFSASDRILVSGNYGLGDTASVVIIK